MAFLPKLAKGTPIFLSGPERCIAVAANKTINESPLVRREKLLVQIFLLMGKTPSNSTPVAMSANPIAIKTAKRARSSLSQIRTAH